MRITYRSARTGTARHNGRDFDLSKANHINENMTSHNWDWHCFQQIHPELTLEQAEQVFYEKRYSAALKETNDNYKKHYHPERCKTIENLLLGDKTRPSETIFQIGNKDEHPDYHLLQRAWKDFMDYISRWNAENGRHLHLLSFSVHVDESTPHIHLRTCWDYQDDKGNYRLGQEKALALAGVELPDPDKKPGRYNNRKMTFDAMMREKWQEIVKSHGLEIETTPLPRRKNKIKEAFIDGQIAKKQSELQQLEGKVEKLERQVEWTKDLRDKQQELWK